MLVGQIDRIFRELGLIVKCIVQGTSDFELESITNHFHHLLLVQATFLGNLLLLLGGRVAVLRDYRQASSTFPCLTISAVLGDAPFSDDQSIIGG